MPISATGREERLERDTRERLLVEQRPGDLADDAPVAGEDEDRARLRLLDEPLALFVDGVERRRADRAHVLQ
jgi:hypothetical protein